jgi:hypothetical protein
MSSMKLADAAEDLPRGGQRLLAIRVRHAVEAERLAEADRDPREAPVPPLA